MLVKLSHKISELGQDKSYSDIKNKEIFLVNNVMKILLPFAMIGFIGESLINHKAGMIIYSITILIGISGLLLNKYKKHFLAKINTLLAIPLTCYTVIIVTEVLKPAYYITIPIVFLVLSSFSVLFFSSKKERVWRNIFIVLYAIIVVGHSHFLDYFFNNNFFIDNLQGTPIVIDMLILVCYFTNIGAHHFFLTITNRQRALLEKSAYNIITKNQELNENKKELQENIKELKTLQRSLIKSKQENERILTAVKKGNILITYNLNGEVIELNSRLLKSIGQNEIPQKVSDFFNLESWMSKLEYITFLDALKEGSVLSKQIEFYQKNTLYNFSFSFSPVFDSSGEISRILAIGQDHSEIVLKQKTIEKQATQIENKNNILMDSINYAKKIQGSMLDTNKLPFHIIKNHFIINKPKQIVSGDFYWTHELPNKLLIGVFDCTGHGVPGCLVSIIGRQLLNRAVNEFGLDHPNQILNKVNELIRQEFGQGEVKDGMDAALIAIDYTNNLLEFSGAYNPVTILTTQGLIKLKGDKFPIGNHWSDLITPFTPHSIPLNNILKIYLYSDGFKDQFGGIENRKIGNTGFSKLLEETSTQSMAKQGEELSEHFNIWMGSKDQLDDVMVVGIELNHETYRSREKILKDSLSTEALNNF